MSKSRYWLAALGLLSVAVVVVMAILAYLLFTFPAPANNPSPTVPRPALTLPTAPLPTATSGPRLPVEILFVPEEPVQGYANCEIYGFKGTVSGDRNVALAGLQVVVWSKKAGLVALDTIKADGSYLIEVQAEPAERQLWVQVYQNDVPVSEPLFLKTHIDCQNGFQIYQINWHTVPMADGE